MLTFEEARATVTAETGQPTQPVGFEGPDSYLVVPDVDAREIVFNDTVITVEKESGMVRTERYRPADMGAWPRVEGA